MPIAASATSQSTPPWSVPMGFACCGPASSSKTAFPGSTEVRRNPMSSETGAPISPALIRSTSVATTSHPDRVPDGLELEEGGDLVGTLVIGPSAHDPLHVLRAEPLELGDIAVRASEVERDDVHVRRDRRRELATQAGDDVRDSRRNVGGGKAFGELDRDERVRLG